MKAPAKVGILMAVVLLVAILSLPIFSATAVRSPQTKALSDAKQVALGLLLYAEDHHDKLPNNLFELVPDYLPERSLLKGLYLATPRATLKDLGPNTVILRTKIPEILHYSVIVHANMHGEVEKL